MNAVGQGGRATGWVRVRVGVVVGLLAWSTILGSGCAAAEIFQCSSDGQCGTSGVCEGIGYCSFPDPSCVPSRRRFDTYAGDGMADACVDVADETSSAESPEGASNSLDPTTVADSDPSADGATLGGDCTGVNDASEGEPTTTAVDSATTDGQDGTTEGGTGLESTGTGAESEPTTTSVTVADDASATGQGPDDPCFEDGFGDGTFDPFWQGPIVNGVATAAETGGQLRLTVQGGASITVQSAALGDRKNTLARFEVAQISGAASEVLLGIGSGANRAVFAVNGTLIGARLDQGAPGVTQAIRAFSQDVRFVQIREEQGSLFWEASADGVTFGPFVSQPTPDFIAAGTTRIQMIVNGAGGAAQDTVVDSVVDCVIE